VTATISSMGQMQEDAASCYMRLQSNPAPMTGSVRFYSRNNHLSLDNVFHKRLRSLLSSCCSNQATQEYTSLSPAPGTACSAVPLLLLVSAQRPGLLALTLLARV